MLIRRQRARAYLAWREHLANYQASLRAWRGDALVVTAERCLWAEEQPMLLCVQRHLLAALSLWLLGSMPARPYAPGAEMAWPPLVMGAEDDDSLAVLVQRAVSHQRRAMVWMRRMKAAHKGALSAVQRRNALLRAMEHIATAHQFLERARTISTKPELDARVDQHRGQLADIAQQIDRLIADSQERACNE
jgi:hypothetical protein